ncbi:DUF6053 domain-containing protein [Lysobacter enzymogenes]
MGGPSGPMPFSQIAAI